MNQENGIFTISLDFELYWGVRDKRSVDNYKENLFGARSAIPEILKLFAKYEIHATWAAVGFLFFNDINELKKNSPKECPNYKNNNLSPYKYINETHELIKELHFAPELIQLIMEHDHQEIGTHTFSHYYCLEDGQTADQFHADIKAAIAIANQKGIAIKSLIFPRNQTNKNYISIIKNLGILCYRGNQPAWIYNASEDSGQSRFQRAVRLLDAYLNLSGHNTYELKICLDETPFNILASRFLRPYSKRLAFAEPLRIKRITDSMTYAAINKQIYHLWWHPHNFGKYTKENLNMLEKILSHYQKLRNQYAMTSRNMEEISQMQN